MLEKDFTYAIITLSTSLASIYGVVNDNLSL